MQACLVVALLLLQEPPPDRTVKVTGQVLEDEIVGPYKQPEWSTKRWSAATRVFVHAMPGEAEFEQWLEIRKKKKVSEPVEVRLRQEFTYGLGDRLQLDLYVDSVHFDDGKDSTFEWMGWSGELRYALADWGELPGNPTLYFEYKFQNGASDKIEPKLLLGGEICRGWRWGFNAVYERTLAGFNDRNEEFKGTATIHHALKDGKLAVGLATEVSYETERGGGASEFTYEALVGPSLQYRPQPKSFIDIEPLFGVTGESKRMKTYIVFGFEF